MHKSLAQFKGKGVKPLSLNRSWLGCISVLERFMGKLIVLPTSLACAEYSLPIEKTELIRLNLIDKAFILQKL
jgi:hypothetical protein